VKKWRWRHSMRATLGRGEKGRRMGRDVVEDGEASAAHTWDREAVRQPGDDGKMAVAEELGGGGAQAQRGEEDSRDGCGKDRVRASASYRGWREVEVARIGRAAVVNSVLTRVVTGVRGGEEMRPMTSLTGHVYSMAQEEGGAAEREEEASLSRSKRRRKREAGRVGWAKWPSGPAGCWADWAGS
jgi:hypothetical protein